MPLIEAAGGLTTNAQGEILMIFRHNHWDMPKGKREAGESIETCALREVEEECAVSGLRLGALITHTYHCYRIKKRWAIKKTTWYKMSYDGTKTPTPQRQEGITQALFVPREQAMAHLKESYYTIRDLFHAAGYEEKN